MIEPMIKASIISLEREKKQALKELATLGLLHVNIAELKESEDRIAAAKKLENVSRALSILSSAKKITSYTEEQSNIEPEKITEQIIKTADENANLAKELTNISAKIETLSEWGDFNPEDIRKLQSSGIHIYFCQKTRDEEFIPPTNSYIKTIKQTKKKELFLLISRAKIQEEKLPLAELDFSKPLSSLIEKQNKIRSQIQENYLKLSQLKIYSKKLEKYKKNLEQKYKFCEAFDSMKDKGILSVITGYLPKKDEDKIIALARKCGWAIITEDASADDRSVPTLIKTPKIFQIIRPIFDFIGIEPGYDEVDVSVSFFFFFSIFFAMIIGDAGYGILFLLAAIFAKLKFKDRKDLKQPLNLFTHLSICTIIWGALCGSWFSIDSSKLPEQLRGIKALSDPQYRDKTIQTFCFLLAGFHLSIGRIWRAAILSNLKSLGQLGWLAMIWANFFLIKGLLVDAGMIQFKIMLPLLIIALILLLIFYVDWHDLGSIFNFPFSVIGSFSDVLSYIRLYAVGLASYYLALNINQIGRMFFSVNVSPSLQILLFIIGTLIIVSGHTLNITLCLLGVLVHGVRLNALEFSNHMELQWKGLKYQPLKIQENNIGE